jgi:hypothetical protein
MDMPFPGLLADPVLAGLAPSPVVRDTLAARCPGIRLQRDRQPPHRDGMLRVETASGRPFHQALAGSWHRPPYTLASRLARYAPGSALPEVLDHAVIGTRGERDAFYRHAEQTALRMVADTMQGRGRGDFCDSPQHLTDSDRGVPFGGRINHVWSRWAGRLCSEWWSLGVTATPLAEIVNTGRLGTVTWLNPDAGQTYLADPFPWPGTSEILAEEMPMHGGHGRIVALSADGGTYRRSRTILEDGYHHSYPCTFQEGETTWLLPEATERGATVLYRLDREGRIHPMCPIAPERRLADSTLFRHGGRYWIACSDLDAGAHDSLCLLHADRLEGPWKPHRLYPARIDIRGARPAGAVFRVNDRLYRPGQNCAVTYGGGITIYRIDVLTPDDYRETAVSSLSPDTDGPFPHGLHTLVSDGTRTWVDGKRFVLDWHGLLHKVGRRAERIGRKTKSGAGSGSAPTAPVPA